MWGLDILAEKNSSAANSAFLPRPMKDGGEGFEQRGGARNKFGHI